MYVNCEYSYESSVRQPLGQLSDQRSYTFRAIYKFRNVNAKHPPFKTHEKCGYESSSPAPDFIKISNTLAHRPERKDQEF